jgi:hypothetical protein
MIKSLAIALALCVGSTMAFAADDDDDKVPDAELAKVKAAIAEFGCTDFEGIKKEEQGIYEIDDAKCKMGTMDIKLDKDLSVILISRY